MRRGRHGEPPAVVRARLVRATTELIASGGIESATPPAISSVARQEVSAVTHYYGSHRQLLRSTIRRLTSAPVLLEAVPRDPAAIWTGPAHVIEALARAHRSYVDADPVRFAALARLSSAASVGHPEYMAGLRARNAASRAAAATHFGVLRAAGQIDPLLSTATIASSFVDAMTGIELCFSVEGDQIQRDAAYRELCQAFTGRLKRGASTHPDRRPNR